MSKKVFVVELSTDNNDNIDAAEVHLALMKYFVAFVGINVKEAAEQSVQRTADRLCTDAVHVGPFKITPEGNTKCDACGAEWYNPNR